MMKMGKSISLLVASVMILSSVAYASNDASAKLAVQEAYGKLPLYFIQNNGQMDGKVKFYEKGNGHATFFTKDGVSLSLVRGSKVESVKLSPLVANKTHNIFAEEVLPGKINYFKGNNVRKWETGIPAYQSVIYKEIYKDIDMKFYGNNRQLEYDIIVKPGADPSQVKLAYEGIKGLKITADGDLEIKLKESSIMQSKPVIYQEIDGKRVSVDGKFKILNQRSKYAYGFEIASYDKKHPLIIDPIVLLYSTYLGGSDGIYEGGSGIAVDNAGNAYIVGTTQCTDFPIAYPFQGSHAGGVNDIFVTKISASGDTLVYSTFIGGSGSDGASGIAVDSSGNVYITGGTDSVDFPLMSSIQGVLGGGSDAFALKLNAAGNNLVYSTYLGGSSDDSGKGIAIDAFGNAAITGKTTSSNFPTVNALQGSYGGGSNGCNVEPCGDAFIAKINAAGDSLVYSTYLGGSGDDGGNGIAVDGTGNAYITGQTYSIDFPTASPIQPSFGGGWGDAFVTKIDAAGSGLLYSTYLGGGPAPGDELGTSISVDTTGNAYVTGITYSADFPTASPYQGTYAGGYGDAFVTKINASGSGFVYSTFLGGGGGDSGMAIAADGSGNAYVTGGTESGNFPLSFPIKRTMGGTSEAFVTKINATGSSLSYSTYLGGSHWDGGQGIAVDASGNAYVTGYTYATDFPTVNPIQATKSGGYTDAFVTKIGPKHQH